MKLQDFINRVRSDLKDSAGSPSWHTEMPTHELAQVVGEIVVLQHEAKRGAPALKSGNLAWHRPTQSVVLLAEHMNLGPGWVVRPKDGGRSFGAHENELWPLC